ncbi:MAG: RecX family transcriptional regulator [Spirochaetia bacterium]|nr:RecX family transcriptional regulator [Spirochaetia bacterium]
MRIESVRYNASGDATLVASGGIIFFLPRHRIEEFAHQAAARLGIVFEATIPDTTKSFLDQLCAAQIDFDSQDSLIQMIRHIDETWKAEKKGLELCARAEQSSQRLKTKLIARGFSPDAAAEAVRRLAKAGAVDDIRFASLWARVRAEGRCEGPVLVAAGLRARGLGQVAIREALSSVDFDALIPGAVEKEAKRLSKRRSRMGDREASPLKDEIYRSLKAQGFDASLLRERLGY